MKVFIQFPHNLPTGGTKVANQIASLFVERGNGAYIVTPIKMAKVSWMKDTAECISQADMLNMCGADDIVIDNWNDRQSTEAMQRTPAKTKVFYCQDTCFPTGKNTIGHAIWSPQTGYTHYWAVSECTRRMLEKRYSLTNIFVVNPIIPDAAHARFSIPLEERNGVLCLARRGPRHIAAIVSDYLEKVDFTIVSEREFNEWDIYDLMGRHKYFLGATVRPRAAMSIPRYLLSKLFPKYVGGRTERVRRTEGFGLPPAEAAAAGCIVIGYAMGGGLEWMTKDNVFLARDRSIRSLKEMMGRALKMTDGEAEKMRKKASNAVKRLSKDHTWSQIQNFLRASSAL